MLRLVVIIFGFSMVGAHAEDTPSTVMFWFMASRHPPLAIEAGGLADK